MTKAVVQPISREPLEVRPELGWHPDVMRAHPWLAEFADVPADAAPPLAMTPPHPEAVCSYGWSGCTHLEDEPDIITWAEAEHRMTLRWWQRLAIVRQHEHRDDGTLCWDEMIESASRRSGKSHRMRAVATWRLAHAAIIGELQAVVHCGNDLATCRDVQKKAWRWAENKWGRAAVTKGNGKELVENPHDGSHWMVKAQDAAYGVDANLVLVDESWDVKPDTVTEGLEPMLLERLWAQLHMTGTAHRRARSTQKVKIKGCLAADDDRTLLLWWGARPQDDPGDPAVWRAASPHWSAHRAKLMASKYEKALAGEEDPEADDPDPMEGFRAQYLNVWSLNLAKSERGEPIVDRVAWGELVAGAPSRVPDAVAIESYFDAGASIAFAWRLDDGAAAVRVVGVADVAEAATLIPADYRGKIKAGSSLHADPALKGRALEKGEGQPLTAVLELVRLLAGAELVHDGGDALSAQVLAIRMVKNASGPRLASTGRVDAVKAAVWAITAARAKPRSGGRVLTATV